MAGHTNWKRFRDKALNDPEVRAGYDRADRAIRFGDAVREAREAAGISQAELARRMNTGQPTIARLELGGVDPKLSTIERINRALGTELVIQFAPPPTSTAAPPRKRITFTPQPAPHNRPVARAPKDSQRDGDRSPADTLPPRRKPVK